MLVTMGCGPLYRECEYTTVKYRYKELYKALNHTEHEEYFKMRFNTLLEQGCSCDSLRRVLVREMYYVDVDDLKRRKF